MEQTLIAILPARTRGLGRLGIIVGKLRWPKNIRRLGRNKKELSVIIIRNASLERKKAFILTFSMFQHTSSEVISL